jgi:hypothetical protein
MKKFTICLYLSFAITTFSLLFCYFSFPTYGEYVIKLLLAGLTGGYFTQQTWLYSQILIFIVDILLLLLLPLAIKLFNLQQTKKALVTEIVLLLLLLAGLTVFSIIQLPVLSIIQNPHFSICLISTIVSIGLPIVFAVVDIVTMAKHTLTNKVQEKYLSYAEQFRKR